MNEQNHSNEQGIPEPINLLLEGYWFTELSAAQLRKSGVTDYCNQVCGGGNCGGEGLCQYGIDSNTHMPPEVTSVCSKCGEQVESIIGCPDGAEVCQQCFDAGLH